MSEMVANLRAITAAVGVPVVADADTGYGGVLNLRRTVREYEEAGAAALHIEDQAWPKRCGFLTGKRLIGLEEMVVRVLAACAARRSPDLVLIARTDALGPLGWEEAERRARAYRAAGADLVFVDGIRTLEDLRRYAGVLADVPKLYSGVLPVDAVAPLGFELMMPLGTMLAAYGAVRDAMQELRDTGTVARGGDLATLDEMLAVLGLRELRAFEDTHA
jgi:2-methylisocitrate lyase-like PEP mutase family enzyme